MDKINFLTATKHSQCIRVCVFLLTCPWVSTLDELRFFHTKEAPDIRWLSWFSIMYTVWLNWSLHHVHSKILSVHLTLREYKWNQIHLDTPNGPVRVHLYSLTVKLTQRIWLCICNLTELVSPSQCTVNYWSMDNMYCMF